jgi:hypothetical protein
MNPFAEPELVSKLLHRLPARDLAAVAADGSLHVLVRELANRLWSGRAAASAAAEEAEPRGEADDDG